MELLSDEEDHEDPDMDKNAFAETQVDTQVDDGCEILDVTMAEAAGEAEEVARPSNPAAVALEDVADPPPPAPEDSRRSLRKGKQQCFDNDVVDVDELDELSCDACDRKMSKCHCMRLRQLKQTIATMKNLQAARKRTRVEPHIGLGKYPVPYADGSLDFGFPVLLSSCDCVQEPISEGCQ